SSFDLAKATFAVFVSFGSTTTRETNRRGCAVAFALVGQGPVMSTSGEEPVVVAKTFPKRIPTMRTPSSWGEMPIALTATGPAAMAWRGDWLTGTMVTARSEERKSV